MFFKVGKRWECWRFLKLVRAAELRCHLYFIPHVGSLLVCHHRDIEKSTLTWRICGINFSSSIQSQWTLIMSWIHWSNANYEKQNSSVANKSVKGARNFWITRDDTVPRKQTSPLWSLWKLPARWPKLLRGLSSSIVLLPGIFRSSVGVQLNSNVQQFVTPIWLTQHIGSQQEVLNDKKKNRPNWLQCLMFSQWCSRY